MPVVFPQNCHLRHRLFGLAAVQSPCAQRRTRRQFIPSSSVVWIIPLMFCWAPWSFAQISDEFVIPYIDRTPELDDFPGMVASPEIERMMARVEGFIQREPDNGQPASQDTTVYVAYDNRNIYAIFLAFDTEPELIRANLAPRENVIDDDVVALFIDTFNDQRTAYVFGATPRGVQIDGRWSEIAKQSNFDRSYEAVWYSDARRADAGYMVKMTIPLRTLRFPDTEEQEWRVMFERRIPRSSEQAHWPRYESTIEGRLNQTAVMKGVRDVSPGRNIQFIPFAFARTFDVLDARAVDGPAFNDDSEENIGLDAKFVFQDSLVLDATLNPDFSQVESDEPQVTVNERFEVRFPERRPFFVENADYFNTESTLVFTRRIVDPNAGLRFTGKLGPWGIGTMLINDEAPGQGRAAGDPLAGDAADISILRAFRDISEQGRVGILYTEREFGPQTNRVSSLDGRFKLSPNWTTEWQAIGTSFDHGNGLTTNGRQSNVRLDRSGRNLVLHVHRIDTSEDFRSDLGFFSSSYHPDTQSTHGNVRYTFWPEGGSLNSWAGRLFFNRIVDQSSTELSSQIMPSLSWSWDGQTELTLSYEDMQERLRPQDFPGLPGNRDYAQEQWTMAFETQMFSTVGFSLELGSGETINLAPAPGFEPELAESFNAQFELLWRPLDRLRHDFAYLYTQLDDPDGRGRIFTDHILRSRWNYQFTRELSLRFIAQHEATDPGPFTSLARDENLNFDLLARYVINPWSALYAGFNTNSTNFALVDTETGTEVVRTNGLQRDGKQLFVKFSYLLQP